MDSYARRMTLLNFYINQILENRKLVDSRQERGETDTLGWDDLVAQKRRLSNELKGITDRLIDLDKNQLHRIAGEIREQRSTLDSFNERLRQIRADVEKHN